MRPHGRTVLATVIAAAAAGAVAAAVLAAPPALAGAGGPDGTGEGGARVVLPTLAWDPVDVRLDRDDPERAWARGLYRCSEEGANSEMWLVVRQAPGIGSPEIALGSVAVYDARLRSFVEQVPARITCDGRWHQTRIPLERQVGSLQEGPALFQWCVRDRDDRPVNSGAYATGCTIRSVPVT